MEISQGRCAPHEPTRERILSALGLDPSNPIHMKRVFPVARRRNRNLQSPVVVVKPDGTNSNEPSRSSTSP